MLLECLVEQPLTYTLIAPKVINIDIDKHSPADLARIYTPKFEAILKRLKVFETFNFSDKINILVNHIKNLQTLIECLQRIKCGLSDQSLYIEYRQ